jgi:hypothetical protein
MRLTAVLLLALAIVPGLDARAGQHAFPVQEGWLSVPAADFNLDRTEAGGVDLGYLAPDAFIRLSGYDAVMVDQPEVWVAAESPYRGAKPDQLKALADFTRDRLIGRLIRGGYNVVEVPGPGVLYLRLALTDLYLSKRRRAATDYTPIEGRSGAALLDTQDLLAVAIQAELTDSQTGDVLAALIIERGNPRGATGLDQAALGAIVDEYSERLRCRLDNSRRVAEAWVDCSDPVARRAPRGD